MSTLFEDANRGIVEAVCFHQKQEPYSFKTYSFKTRALRIASATGHTEVVRLLLDSGANMYTCGDCALQSASENGHIEVVRLLLDRGAYLHTRRDCALRVASSNGHIEVVRLLLDRGAHFYTRSHGALRSASANRHPDVVRLLLEYGSKFEYPTSLSLEACNQAMRQVINAEGEAISSTITRTIQCTRVDEMVRAFLGY